MYATPPAAAARQRARWCAVDGFGVFGGVPHGLFAHAVQRCDLLCSALRPENADNLSAFFGRRPMRGEWWWNRWNRWNGNFGKSLKARVLGNFRNICSICSICSMRCAAPRKKPRKQKKTRGGGVERGTERSYANGSSSSEGVRRRIPRQQRNRLPSRRVLVGR